MSSLSSLSSLPSPGIAGTQEASASFDGIITTWDKMTNSADSPAVSFGGETRTATTTTTTTTAAKCQRNCVLYSDKEFN